ncbi:HipA domain-containing protein [Colwellia piezophila]|uniref:HipA domain-containing protein n=1 Tax=Colwellia piezophila TaxID=211668 RepID=UPI00036B3F43|nr:HipA domain-containing protein [Colwellia piezophila]
MSYSLDVVYGLQVIGQLSQHIESGLLELSYSQKWQESGFAISPALTFEKQHDKAAAYNFLDNLLPEGEARKLLAQDIGVNEKQVFPQIRAIGNDLSGAFSFLSEQVLSADKAVFRLIKVAELSHRLDHKEDIGLLQWDDKPRLSVAGVQDKLNVFLNEQGEIGLADGSLSSTYILKFERKNCANLVINEYFCMKLSHLVGLPTSEVTLKRFGKHPALSVKRFDRRFDVTNNKVLRKHVIDGCQALNLPRDYKYERNLGDGRDVKHIRDGANLEQLFSFCRKSSEPIANMQWLINWQLFNLLISNYDSHGKNVSFFYGANETVFTPAYDLVNVAMFDQFKHTLAMAMGDEFEPDTINAYQLADFADSCQLDRKLVRRMLIKLATKVLKILAENNIISELETTDVISQKESDYLNQVSENIKKRTIHLLEQADEVVLIEL